VKSSLRLRGGEVLELGEMPADEIGLIAQSMPLQILYEDDDLLVLDKPRGLTVHPGAGRPSGTLVNALLAHTALSAGSDPGRPGIVHRLDKDTSGLLVVAKNDQAHAALAGQFTQRQVEKDYLALVHGIVAEEEGRIEVPLARSSAGIKIAPAISGRRAVTEFRVLARYPLGFSLLKLHPETGRTHQLRVHLAFIGHPIVGDPLYGPSNPWGLEGQLLHAQRLAFRHPTRGQEMVFETPLPSDFERILALLGEPVDKGGEASYKGNSLS
jgi:23S rRNA pseudouridine1911/1915/1917 synthase